MAEERRRPTHRSAFGASAAGASPSLDPPLTPAGDGGGLAPWRRPSGSWRYRPAWFQPVRQQEAAPETVPERQGVRAGRVLLAAGACALAVAVLVAGTLLVTRVGGPGGGARPVVAARPRAVLPAGTVVLAGDSFRTMLPAGWQEVPATGLGTGKPGPDERAAVGENPSGLEPMVMIGPAGAPLRPIQELAADELRSQTLGARGVDVDGPLLRTVAGAQAAVLDVDDTNGATSAFRRVVLIVHGLRVLRVSLIADRQSAPMATQAVDSMLAAWRWTG